MSSIQLGKNYIFDSASELNIFLKHAFKLESDSIFYQSVKGYPNRFHIHLIYDKVETGPTIGQQIGEVFINEDDRFELLWCSVP